MLQLLLDQSRGVGPGKSLENKAREAQKAYGSGKPAATCSLLNEYIREVKAQTGKKISKPTATDLTETAGLIRTSSSVSQTNGRTASSPTRRREPRTTPSLVNKSHTEHQRRR